MAELLGRIHSQQGVLHRTILRPQFALRIEEQAPLSIVICPDTDAYMWFGGEDPVQLPAGHVAIVATPAAYTFADDVKAEVRYLIQPDGATLPDGTVLPPSLDDVNCLVEPGGDTVVISGNYGVSAGLGDRLLAGLPRVALVDLAEWDSLLTLLAAELAANRPGRQVFFDRWLDLVLVSALRSWFEQDGNAPGWYAAREDEVVGPALPASLAASRNVSLAALGSPAFSSRCARTARSR